MLTLSGSAPSLSILLTAISIGTSAAFAWSIASTRLRHDAVVGGDDDDRDVGDLGAAGAHRRERLVARGVEEGDRLALGVDLVGADVLGDATGLAGGDLGLADRVEQRGLAVVDVAHHGDDRRAVDEVGVVVVVGSTSSSTSSSAWTISTLRSSSSASDLDGLVGERLGQRRHLAQLHQLS